MVDASAALALILREPGWERALDALENGVMSIVNLAEVVQRLVRGGAEPEGLAAGLVDRFEAGGVVWDRPALDDAAVVGAWGAIRNFSLGDRFCVAAAVRRAAPVVTADREWATYGLPVEIEFIR
ncbi:MAG: PIN domain-containing protein [Pseudomonadota bacterium]